MEALFCELLCFEKVPCYQLIINQLILANQLRSILFCCNLNSLNYRSGHISMSLQSTIGSENVSPKHATLFYLQSVQNENIQGKFCVFVSLLRSRSQIFFSKWHKFPLAEVQHHKYQEEENFLSFLSGL